MQTSHASERQIALPWLARLRWFAVLGQIAATGFGIVWLDLRLPLFWISLLILVTALSNLVLLAVWDRLNPPPHWIVPAVLLLDVCTFTLLLYFTGGTDNPFSILYAIHVAMAVVMLGGAWAWGIAVISAIAYALLYFWRVPLSPELSEPVWNVGQWSAVVLVMMLIAYFVGRVMRSLRQRERELADARERASRGEHLASLTALAAGAAHELGTPLGTIALAAKEMQHAVDPGSLLADDAQLIRQEVDRCRQILDRMRVDVIEDAAEHPTFETLADLFEELQQDLRPGERARLVIETTEAEDRVISRSRVLRRAVGVLLRNAFDASKPDDNVRLQFLRREPERMIFQVQDSGAGMPESVLRRAGQPFFTTKAPVGSPGTELEFAL